MCKATIDTAEQQCRFCSARIDPEEAQAAANAMATLDQACSDASIVKITAGRMPAFAVFLLLLNAAIWFAARQLEIHISVATYWAIALILGRCGLSLLSLVTTVLAIRWWVRFRAIVSDNPDFLSSKRTVIVVGIPVSILFLTLLILFCFLRIAWPLG
jgi:hypothetical protein